MERAEHFGAFRSALRSLSHCALSGGQHCRPRPPALSSQWRGEATPLRANEGREEGSASRSRRLIRRQPPPPPLLIRVHTVSNKRETTPSVASQLLA